MLHKGRLTSALRRSAGETILVHGERRFTGDEILSRFEQLATGLDSHPGSRVVSLGNEPQQILASLCLADEVGVSVLLVPDHLAESLPELVESTRAQAIIRHDGVEYTGHQQPVQTEGPEVLLLTSGTSGTPKIARHKWQTLFARIKLPTRQHERVWLLTYLPTGFAGVQVLLTAVASGDCVVSAPKSFADSIKVAAECDVTHLSCTPTFFRGLSVAGACESLLPRLQQITLGGEIADEQTLRSAHMHFSKVRISHIYAATETGSLFSVSDGHEGFPKNWLQEGIEGTQLRIVDDTLQVSSPRAMVGYANDESVSGWIDTGDLVRVEGDRVKFMGRRDRRINVGGLKTFPEDVERAIMEIPGVVDVLVTGVANPMSGETVVADVVPAPGNNPEELRGQIASHVRRRLANHQIPRIIRFVSNIPISPSGKKCASLPSA